MRAALSMSQKTNPTICLKRRQSDWSFHNPKSEISKNYGPLQCKMKGRRKRRANPLSHETTQTSSCQRKWMRPHSWHSRCLRKPRKIITDNVQASVTGQEMDKMTEKKKKTTGVRQSMVQASQGQAVCGCSAIESWRFTGGRFDTI